MSLSTGSIWPGQPPTPCGSRSWKSWASTAGSSLSPSDLSRELQIPLSNTNYHVTELAKVGLIELVRERQVRGATEHFYRLPVRVPTETREPATV